MQSEAAFNLWLPVGRSGLARFRRSRALAGAGALLGVLALLLQAWLPLLHPPAIAAFAEPAFLADGFPLCLAGGGEHPLPIKSPAQKPAACPICQAFHLIASFVPPAAAVPVAVPAPVAPAEVPTVAAIIGPASRGAAQPRAPPVAV